MALDLNDLLRAFVVLVVIGLPSLALTVTLTARFAARPIVDAIVRLRELSSPVQAAQLEARVGAMETEMREVRALLERVATAVEFDAQLRAAEGGGIPRLPQA